MKNISLVFVFVFQLATAHSKDSTLLQKPFTNSFKFPEKVLCDACGCSASGGSMGFASMLNSNFVGVRYFNQSYKSTDGLYTNSPWYSERFNTTQIWARMPLSNAIQITALLPYHLHQRDTETGTQEISGLGDVTVMALYKLYQTKKDSSVFIHNLQVGGGVKAPTGRFDLANAGNVNPSFQVGTGSWDYLLATEYVLTRKNLGLNTMLNYVFKTENEKHYRFGNQFNYASTLFYILTKNQLTVVPQMGVAGEIYDSNFQYSEVVQKTSGTILFSKFGVEIGKNKFSLGANVMLPLNQNLAANRVEANYRWSLNFNYSL